MKKKVKLLTMRQFMFLHWLFQRKVKKKECDLTNTDIDCYNCLRKNETCREGYMPASFFSKKTDRQFYDTKRVLYSLKEMDLISEVELNGNLYSIFYKIKKSGIEYYKKFREFYNLND